MTQPDLLNQHAPPMARSAPMLWPILMHKDEVINLKAAVHRTGRDEKTIRGWCKEFGIGRQTKPGAPLDISAPALEMVIHGDIAALELLREGARSHPRVKRYFAHLGIAG